MTELVPLKVCALTIIGTVYSVVFFYPLVPGFLDQYKSFECINLGIIHLLLLVSKHWQIFGSLFSAVNRFDKTSNDSV